MKIFKEIKALRAYLGSQQKLTKSIGLVPTMGALHQGHLSLVSRAKAQNDLVVATIFVNPTQFNNPSDLQLYPRHLDKDVSLLTSVGCDVLFAPEVSEMYPVPSLLKFDFGDLDKILEGKFRPGHFSGVALIVSKLFNIIQPTKAYFGQKDYQQFKVISKLKSELLFDLELECVSTLREPDGLAMSSRNLRLSPDERKKAIVFYESLLQAEQMLMKGQGMNFIRETIKAKCNALDSVRLEYIELADAENLTLQESVLGGEQVLLIAGYVNEVRLIDNLLIRK